MQYNRKLRVTFHNGFVVNPGGFAKQQLRVALNAEKTISGVANEFQLRLWNLSEAHRNSLGRELETVKVEGGFAPFGDAETVGVVAEGYIRDYEHERFGPDIITTLTGGDGDAAVRRAIVNVTIPAGGTLNDAVTAIYNGMEAQGVSRGEWKIPGGDRQFARPYVLSGACITELDILGRGHKFYWSIQNGALEIISGDGFLAGDLTISETTGMVGTPVVTDNGVEVTALLNAAARPNRLMYVRSDILRLNGLESRYRMSKVTIDADNTEGDFFMTCVGETVVQDKVNEGEVEFNRYQAAEE